MKNYIYNSTTGDGYMNLSVDQYILHRYRNGSMKGVTMYFYVNDNAVIIGRNQNAWRECRVEAMQADGVQLVRRHTGGGAVYHDRGNLNFSFITNEKHYNVKRQTEVIARACRKFGIETEVSGRNDILTDGRKFSGNAFALEGIARGHHGTVLINVDMTKLSNYLNVSKQKLRAKGVASVRSRVCNLNDIAPVTVEAMRDSIIEQFELEYGNVEPLVFGEDDLRAIDEIYAVQSSWEWRLGMAPAFDHIIETKLPAGEIQLHTRLKSGIIAEAKVYTDALDTDAASEIETLVLGSRLDKDELYSRLIVGGEAARQLAGYILTEGVNNENHA